MYTMGIVSLTIEDRGSRLIGRNNYCDLCISIEAVWERQTTGAVKQEPSGAKLVESMSVPIDLCWRRRGMDNI